MRVLKAARVWLYRRLDRRHVQATLDTPYHFLRAQFGTARKRRTPNGERIFGYELCFKHQKYLLEAPVDPEACSRDSLICWRVWAKHGRDIHDFVDWVAGSCRFRCEETQLETGFYPVVQSGHDEDDIPF